VILYFDRDATGALKALKIIGLVVLFATDFGNICSLTAETLLLLLLLLLLPLPSSRHLLSKSSSLFEDSSVSFKIKLDELSILKADAVGGGGG
jgi:hypothetical protein